jgi:hypothetical protein
METALRGALVRRAPNVWAWADTGEVEPRVRDLRVRDLAPNYRVIARGGGRRYVEVPRDWPRDVTDPDVEEALRRLCARRPVVDIYAEGVAEALDYHRVTSPGYLVPLKEWDAEMDRVIGATWLQRDEPALLERARLAGMGGEAQDDTATA